MGLFGNSKQYKGDGTAYVNPAVLERLESMRLIERREQGRYVDAVILAPGVEVTA